MRILEDEKEQYQNLAKKLMLISKKSKFIDDEYIEELIDIYSESIGIKNGIILSRSSQKNENIKNGILLTGISRIPKANKSHLVIYRSGFNKLCRANSKGKDSIFLTNLQLQNAIIHELCHEESEEIATGTIRKSSGIEAIIKYEINKIDGEISSKEYFENYDKYVYEYSAKIKALLFTNYFIRLYGQKFYETFAIKSAISKIARKYYSFDKDDNLAVPNNYIKIVMSSHKNIDFFSEIPDYEKFIYGLPILKEKIFKLSSRKEEIPDYEEFFNK